MFARRFILALVFVLATLLPSAMPVAAGTKTSFTVDVTNVKFISEVIEDITYPGGNTHSLHTVQVFTMISSDPRYQGQITFDFFHTIQKQEHPVPGWGPGDGDWWVEVNGQRTWEGTMHMLQREQYLTVQYIGHGVGTNEGLQVQVLNYYNYTFDGTDFTKWTITGEILDPKVQ